jgi:hypothetical protein
MFPVCSFCGEQPVVAWFEGPDFLASVDAAEKVRAEEAWLTCSTCLQLVQRDDREGLAIRGVKRVRRHGTEPEGIVEAARTFHERFWAARAAG